MLIDLHAHSAPRSSCSRATLPGLVETARRRGVDALCLTEHDVRWPADELAAASAAVAFPLIAGVELSTDAGHVLVFGPLLRPLWQGYTLVELAAEADETGAALVLAHPLRRAAGERAARAGRIPPSPEEVAASPAWELVHAVEAMSTQSTTAEHALTDAAARVRATPTVAGSDAHDEAKAGMFATRVAERVRSAEDLAAAIRAGQVEPVRLA